jgi:competence CoiA-like predicted nuclease
MVESIEKRTDRRAPLGVKVSWALDDHQWHEDNSHDISLLLNMNQCQSSPNPYHLSYLSQAVEY